jgi:hypothetical protein
VSALARKHGMAPNEVYRVLEDAKNMANNRKP